MKEFDLKAKKRTEAGKKYTKKIRKEGYTPAIVYGGEEPIMCEVFVKDLKNLIYTDKSYIINLDVDGQIIKCIKKDTQFHPVTDEILHVDFYQLNTEKPVKIYIPVRLEGFSEGVKLGGHLFLLKRYLNVKGNIANIPDEITLDITPLGIGKSLKIADIKIDNIEILEPAGDVVAIVKLTRAAMSEADSEEGAEGTEGEEAAEEKAE